MKIRGFEEVIPSMKKNSVPSILPNKGTKSSAGYDFAIPIDITIYPHSKELIFTDVKAYMQEGEVLTLHVRSSIGIKKGLMLSNITGIIDMDYYSNPDNDGNIGISLYNNSETSVTLKAGERVAQGIFIKFLEADNGNTDNKRSGGVGSSGN